MVRKDGVVLVLGVPDPVNPVSEWVGLLLARVWVLQGLACGGQLFPRLTVLRDPDRDLET